MFVGVKFCEGIEAFSVAKFSYSVWSCYIRVYNSSAETH